ncbi:MAG: nitrophenyl compound nitroreductase subunit ArsF family protein [Thermoguttaceae bacterium]|jgi:hypothetical protein
MSLKDVLTNSLLMFVVATCVVLIVKALPQTPPPQAAAGVSGDGSGALAPKNNPTPTLADRDGVKVYYLHGNTRCPTCRTIEADAEQAILDAFTDDLKSGKIQWQVINYESPGNEHYATDYEVVAPNVVLAMFKDGKQVKWKGLPEVWEHVGDKAKYFAFVQNSLREFLGRPQVAPGRASVLAAPPAAPPPVAPSVPPLQAGAPTPPVPTTRSTLPSSTAPPAVNAIRSPGESTQPSLPLPE